MDARSARRAPPAMADPAFQNSISIAGLMRRLWLIVAGLIAIHVTLTVVHFQIVEVPWYVRQLFDVDEEDSFPTWYSAAALLLTAVALWVNARRQRAAGSPWRWHWQGLAVGFFLLSIDEIAGVHETLNSVIEGSWAVPGAVLVAIIGSVYLKFLAGLDRRTAILFAIGGAVFVGGAVGVELYTEPYLKDDQLNTMAYNLWTAVEEGMEMSGVLIFLGALLRWMKGDAAVQPLGIELRE